jgi:1-deoxy-D-xylulose-5-phosphate synthase
VLIITVGPMAEPGSRWPCVWPTRASVRPSSIRVGWCRCQSVITLAAKHRLVVTIEDGIRVGGIGTRHPSGASCGESTRRSSELGLPDEFLEHGSRAEILAPRRDSHQRIARDVVQSRFSEARSVARPLTGGAQEERSLGSDRS